MCGLSALCFSIWTRYVSFNLNSFEQCWHLYNSFGWTTFLCRPSRFLEPNLCSQKRHGYKPTKKYLVIRPRRIENLVYLLRGSSNDPSCFSSNNSFVNKNHIRAFHEVFDVDCSYTVSWMTSYILYNENNCDCSSNEDPILVYLVTFLCKFCIRDAAIFYLLFLCSRSTKNKTNLLIYETFVSFVKSKRTLMRKISSTSNTNKWFGYFLTNVLIICVVFKHIICSLYYIKNLVINNYGILRFILSKIKFCVRLVFMNNNVIRL